MAAPESLYLKKHVARKSGEADKVIKFTSGGGTSAVLKERFYLDKFDIKEIDGVKYWAGACRVGSPNYYMHNVARYGWRELIQDGLRYRVFNDAGLNTLGVTTQPTQGAEHTIFEFLIDSFSSKSAYYIDGEYGLSFSDDGGVTWKEYSLKDFQDKNTTESSDVYDLGVTRSFPLVATRTVMARSYHENAEGKKYSDITSIYVNAWRITGVRYIGISSWPSLATAPHNDVYASEKIYLGSLAFPAGKLSDNEDGTGLVDSQGWFVTDDFWLKYTGDSPSNYSIVEYGTSTPSGWPIGDPNRDTNPPSIKIDYVYYGSTQVEGCIYSDTIMGSIYRTVDAPFVYYTSAEMTITADGYYSFLETRPNRGNPWNRFVNGILVENGVCPYHDPNS